MKLLLLGASGQLGREWQEFFALVDREDCIVIPYTSDQLDISNVEKVAHELETHQPDVIINCAAYTNVDEAEEERKKVKEINTDAVANLASLCADYNIKLVHFSTDYIFAGEKKDQDQFPQGYPEDHKADPINWYGQTKWEGEEAIRNSGCNHLIMRVSWLCGAFGSNFVTTMLRLAEERTELQIVNDQVGSPTFTDNLVKATDKLIEENKHGTYHFTSQGIISWADFAEKIFDLTNKKVDIHPVPSSEYPTKAERPYFSKLNTRKIEQVDGIKIEDWETGLKHLLENMRIL